MRRPLRIIAHAAALAALSAFGLSLGAYLREPEPGGPLVLLVAMAVVIALGLRQIYRPDGLVRQAPPAPDGTEPVRRPPAGGPAAPREPLFPAAAPPPADTRVDLNRAPVHELSRLPGIGPVAAQRIVDEREANGPFRSVDELARVPGFSPAKVRVIAPDARV